MDFFESEILEIIFLVWYGHIYGTCASKLAWLSTEMMYDSHWGAQYDNMDRQITQLDDLLTH